MYWRPDTVAKEMAAKSSNQVDKILASNDVKIILNEARKNTKKIEVHEKILQFLDPNSILD